MTPLEDREAALLVALRACEDALRRGLDMSGVKLAVMRRGKGSHTEGTLFALEAHSAIRLAASVREGTVA